MDVVGDLLARDRRSRDVALVTADGRERTSHDLITNAYKAANVFRYLGVRQGATVAIDPTPRLHTTLALLGAAALGAVVRFDPIAGTEAGDRAVLIDVADEPQTDPMPGTNLVAFGGPPKRPETTHWEQELWSENPGMPPSSVDPDDAVICGGSDGDLSHRRLLGLARSVITSQRIGSGTRVVLRCDFTDSRSVAAGVIAPLAVGGIVVLPEQTATGSVDPTAHSRGDIAVTPTDRFEVPEPRRVALTSLSTW